MKKEQNNETEKTNSIFSFYPLYILSELFTFHQILLKEDLKENAFGEVMF